MNHNSEGKDIVDGIREGEEDGEYEFKLVCAVSEAFAGEGVRTRVS
jgi:hypothetical protein